MLIRPLLWKHSAFDLAKLFYAQYADLNFEDDLLEYLRFGFVCSRPHLFAMARVVEHEGETMWYIRIAIGDIVELLTVLPFHLDKICFCRNNRADQMRICSTNELARLARRRALKGETQWAAA